MARVCVAVAVLPGPPGRNEIDAAELAVLERAVRSVAIQDEARLRWHDAKVRVLSGVAVVSLGGVGCRLRLTRCGRTNIAGGAVGTGRGRGRGGDSTGVRPHHLLAGRPWESAYLVNPNPNPTAPPPPHIATLTMRGNADGRTGEGGEHCNGGRGG